MQDLQVSIENRLRGLQECSICKRWRIFKSRWTEPATCWFSRIFFCHLLLAHRRISLPHSTAGNLVIQVAFCCRALWTSHFVGFWTEIQRSHGPNWNREETRICISVQNSLCPDNRRFSMVDKTDRRRHLHSRRSNVSLFYSHLTQTLIIHILSYIIPFYPAMTITGRKC